MDTRLQKALKKANAEVEKSGITDSELKKIAFAKAIDFYLHGEKGYERPQGDVTETRDQKESDFWFSLVSSTDIEEIKLKDVYSIKGEQVLLVIPRARIKGKAKADQQRYLSALVIFAYCEGLKFEWVSANLLAEAARHSGLYDTSKFAKNLGNCGWFRVRGRKKGLKYKLSATGVVEAKAYLNELNNI